MVPSEVSYLIDLAIGHTLAEQEKLLKHRVPGVGIEPLFLLNSQHLILLLASVSASCV